MRTRSVANLPRLRSLDGMRGIAACVVVLLHVGWQNHITGARFFLNGYLFVDMFFLISGLVIAANYSDRIAVGAASAMQFLGLRFFRLYPLHIAVLGAFVALECLKLASSMLTGISPQLHPFTGGQSVTALAGNVFLVHGLGWVRQTGWNVPSWSISCECFAYIAFAALAKTRVMRTKWFLICVAAGTIAVYSGIAITRGTLNVILDLGALRCFAGFFSGVLIWEHRKAINSLPGLHRGWVQVAIAGVLFLTIGFAVGPPVAFTIPLFALLILHAKSDTGPIARLLSTRAPQYLGRISYSVYMVHELVIICILISVKRYARVAFDPIIGRDMAVINPWLGDFLVVLLVAVVLLLSSFTYKLIEERGRRLGRRLMYRDSRVNEVHHDIHAGAGRQASESY